MSASTHLVSLRRQARSIRNDTAIHDAVISLADTEGWQGMSLQRVAQAAGLSRPSVLTRYRGRSEAAAAAWSERLDGPVRHALAVVIEAADTAARSSEGSALRTAMRPFIDPGQDMRAAAERILVGNCR